jgi:hypothetical protein
MSVDQVARRLAVGVVMLASTGVVLVASAHAPLPDAPIVRAARQPADVDWMAVQQTLGRPGTMMPGNVFRIGMPRSDLNVTVEGVPVKANFALGSYAAFRPLADGTGQAMVMGDLVLRDEEVPAVMSGLFDNGLQATALHNHALGDQPRLFYMHFWANDPARLATGLRAALDQANAAPTT